jgi:glycerol-3-phosphate dehydrogenase (NAD(P)+)
VELGRGRKLFEVMAAMQGTVAEGVFTTRAALGLAHKYRVDMPIAAQVDAILHQNKPPADAIHELMTRTAKSES